ncbi:shikimate kinase AroK [Aestuariirhabdus litorea]|uniref:Shikimate kinase n=1 Tax=Aestuariirhabdus litorea TaxID=2528527 RepID=A0A3P3VKA2_9GAMM|nr:shikimate kinase AroK [Aestuariirhabdus litorea]RRJ83155.1 shikimate kinase AroK [Aestuariirhabdus litorea]RWW93311.1 shikimate kinase AroK [Endozoicomonadaceae bacterium GTF-13]
MTQPVIFLVGPMGAGKSTIGRLLSKELSIPFKDSDHEIEARSGADIPWIFDVEGEEGFRRRESAVIQQLVEAGPLVIATGGGAILLEENRRLMVGSGTVVYLETSVEQQLSRTARDRKRPLLQTADPRKTLTDLMGIREPLYQQIADITVSTENSNPRMVVQEIVDQLRATVLKKPD